MAFRISATTDTDTELLTLIRDLAWKQRLDVSEVIRQAFKHKLYGSQKHWPKEGEVVDETRPPIVPGRNNK